MKKFVFTLKAVYQYKLTVEKSQKADLKRAQDRLRVLLQEEERLTRLHEKTVQSWEEALSQKSHVGEALAEHDAYFRHLRELKADLAEKIKIAEAEKARCQKLLIATMKEIQTYEKLKDEQYSRYLEEVAKEEAKEMGDIVSYKTIKGETD